MSLDTKPFSTKKEAAVFLSKELERVAKNLARAKGLLRLHEIATSLGIYNQHCPEAEVYSGDILRAAVVLTHANLEDTIRSISAVILPLCNEVTLDTIPLAGLRGSGRPEKFFLGKLAMHRGKTVAELLQESVNEYLRNTNYNDTFKIVSVLQSLGVDVAEVNHTFPKLDQLIARRHQIVHRADKMVDAEGIETVQGIQVEEVEEWINAVQEFEARTYAQLVRDHLNDHRKEA